MRFDEGELFTHKLEKKLVEVQGEKIRTLNTKLEKAIEIGELLRDWLTYSCKEDCSELAARLEQLKEPM